MNLSYTHIISYTQYAVHSIIMYTMLNQEFTVSSRLLITLCFIFETHYSWAHDREKAYIYFNSVS